MGPQSTVRSPQSDSDSDSDSRLKSTTPGVDLYVGGTEHAVLHLLYARFWHKVLFDLGHVSTPEPFFKLVNQGLILGEDGQKMSKSRGNVVNPDDILVEFGADAFRLYEMFMGPLEMVKPWSTKGVDTSSVGSLVMSSAKRVTTSWKTQYDVKLQLSGVPTNSTVAVAVNGKLQGVDGSKATEFWADNNSQLDVEVPTTQIQATSVNYNFEELQVNGQASTSTIQVTKPITITIVFSDQQKAPSSISLDVKPVSAISGDPVKISGSLSVGNNSSTVHLSFSTNKEYWQSIANVSTGHGRTILLHLDSRHARILCCESLLAR